MAKKPTSSEKLDYEEAMAELEVILSNLENEPRGLEKSVEMFERGKSLIQHCQKLLNSAELKVKHLEEDGSTSSIK